MKTWTGYKGWSKHQHFGLRKEWLDLWLERPIDWEKKGALGNRQVESLKVWLRTTGLVDRQGLETPLALVFRERGSSWLEGWQILWVNTVFSFPTARWYVSTFHHGKWKIKDLQHALQEILPHHSPRTVYNSLLELVGLLERTPIGKDLGQGEVLREKGRTGRTVTRKGLHYPSWAAIKRALQLLKKETSSDLIPFDDSLLLPWKIFASDRQYVMGEIAMSGETKIENKAIGLLF